MLDGLKRLADRGVAEGGTAAAAAARAATLDAVARLASLLCAGLTSLLAAMQWGVHQSLQHHAESTRLELVRYTEIQGDVGRCREMTPRARGSSW